MFTYIRCYSVIVVAVVPVGDTAIVVVHTVAQVSWDIADTVYLLADREAVLQETDSPRHMADSTEVAAHRAEQVVDRVASAVYTEVAPLDFC